MNKNYKKKFVSVIIPSYNSSRYLSQAIESVLAQSYKEFEIIVVDDGSTDNTRKAVEKFKDNVIYLYKSNGGPASARNLGISKSIGEYIAFLDADDYWLPKKLKTQIDFIKKHEEFALIHSNTWVFEESKQLYPRFINKQPPIGNVYKQLFLKNFINNLTVILKRE